MERISKLGGAKRHLEEAIRLFFENRDPLAVHTLAAAAQGTLRDIARKRGMERRSILHDNSLIPERHRKDWVNSINEARNFFKHADEDPHGMLEFDESENVCTLLDAVLLYNALADERCAAAAVYLGWFTTAHPEMRDAATSTVFGEYAVRNNISPDNKAAFLELIDTTLLIERARA